MIKELLYECLFYLDWKEYYKLCKYINVDLNIHIYFKYNPQNDPSYLLNVCKEKEEYLEIVEYLCTHKTIQTWIKNNSMNFACQRGHLNIAKYLHSIGNNCISYTVIPTCSNGHLEVVQFLYSIYQFNEHTLRHALHEACLSGQLEIIKYLHLMNPLITTNSNMIHACMNGHLEVAKFLYSQHISIPNYAIEYAAIAGHLDVVKYLCSLKKVRRHEKESIISMTVVNGKTEVANYLQTHLLIQN